MIPFVAGDGLSNVFIGTEFGHFGIATQNVGIII